MPDPDCIRDESLDEGEVENRTHEKPIPPRPKSGTNHQTTFFAHEVFNYFLPAQSRHYTGTPSRRERRGQNNKLDSDSKPQTSEMNIALCSTLQNCRFCIDNNVKSQINSQDR